MNPVGAGGLPLEGYRDRIVAVDGFLGGQSPLEADNLTIHEINGGIEQHGGRCNVKGGKVTAVFILKSLQRCDEIPEHGKAEGLTLLGVELETAQVAAPERRQEGPAEWPPTPVPSCPRANLRLCRP